MRSDNFNRFYDSYFGDPYMAWHDGLDEQALLSLEGEEREEAERLLIAEVKSSGDSRASKGLASLRSTKATPDLKKRLSDATGEERINTALALWKAERWPPAANILIDSLRNEDFWGDRGNAAKALAEVRTPKAVRALIGALKDEEDLVRSHAADALLEMHGLEVPQERDSPTIRVMSEDKKEREQAIKEILQQIAGAKLLEED